MHAPHIHGAARHGKTSSRWIPFLAAVGIHLALLLVAGGLTVFTLPRLQQMMFAATAQAAPAPSMETFAIETEAFEEAVGELAPPDVLASTGLSDLPLPELPETELFDVAAYRESPRRSDLAGAGLASDPFDIAGDAAAGLAEISRTSFFGLKDQAQSVVVIWDVTRSMMNVSGRAGYERVRAEVARLVEGLNADTLFSVIIFAGGTERYSDALVYASRRERDAALAWIRAKNSASAPSPDGTRGANRSDWAIRDALQMGAEVIYLVTDGEPFYSANQPIPPEEIYRVTDELQRKRRVPARLHAVGFGTDTNAKTRDFLQTLAGRNNGSFREIRAGETG